jgi:hypothetical protein
MARLPGSEARPALAFADAGKGHMCQRVPVGSRERA